MWSIQNQTNIKLKCDQFKIKQILKDKTREKPKRIQLKK